MGLGGFFLEEDIDYRVLLEHYALVYAGSLALVAIGGKHLAVETYETLKVGRSTLFLHRDFEVAVVLGVYHDFRPPLGYCLVGTGTTVGNGCHFAAGTVIFGTKMGNVFRALVVNLDRRVEVNLTYIEIYWCLFYLEGRCSGKVVVLGVFGMSDYAFFKPVTVFDIKEHVFSLTRDIAQGVLGGGDFDCIAAQCHSIGCLVGNFCHRDFLGIGIIYTIVECQAINIVDIYGSRLCGVDLGCGIDYKLGVLVDSQFFIEFRCLAVCSNRVVGIVAALVAVNLDYSTGCNLETIGKILYKAVGRPVAHTRHTAGVVVCKLECHAVFLRGSGRVDTGDIYCAAVGDGNGVP